MCVCVSLSLSLSLSLWYAAQTNLHELNQPPKAKKATFFSDQKEAKSVYQNKYVTEALARPQACTEEVPGACPPPTHPPTPPARC